MNSIIILKLTIKMVNLQKLFLILIIPSLLENLKAKLRNLQKKIKSITIY